MVSGGGASGWGGATDVWWVQVAARARGFDTATPPVVARTVRPAQYPEGFQTLLDRGKQNYRRDVINTERPALGKFKAELTGALKLDN